MGRRKFVFASAIAVIMMLAGSISYFLLPVSQFPATTPPQVVVSAVYAGASAQVAKSAPLFLSRQMFRRLKSAYTPK